MSVLDQTTRNPLEHLVGYQLRRASAVLMQELSRDLEMLDLKVTDASVLLLIASNPGVTQSEIGRVLSIQSANMVPIAGALARRGLIARERVDGRSHALTTTEAGSALAAEVRAIMQRHDDRLLSALPDAARTGLAETLSRLW